MSQTSTCRQGERLASPWNLDHFPGEILSENDFEQNDFDKLFFGPCPKRPDHKKLLVASSKD